MCSSRFRPGPVLHCIQHSEDLVKFNIFCNMCSPAVKHISFSSASGMGSKGSGKAATADYLSMLLCLQNGKECFINKHKIKHYVLNLLCFKDNKLLDNR